MPPVLGQISATFANFALVTVGTAAVAIPVAIHLLTRLRRRPMQWAAMRFLTEAFRKHRHRMRIEQWLLLLLRCLIVLALAAALGRPLLVGLAEAWSLSPTRQLVCIVLDDSLSTQARAAGDEPRFEALRSAALSIVDGLQPSDRLWVIRAAAPWEELAAPGGSSPADARNRIASLKPRFSRSELTDVLAAVGEKLAAGDTVRDDERLLVTVLSDFAAATLDVDAALPPAVRQLTKSATLLLTPPAGDAVNVQIARLRPRRRMIVAEDGTALVPIELQLRRFAADLGAATTDIELQLTDRPAGAPLATAPRRYTWAPGQSIATINVELPLDTTGADIAPSSRTLAVEAMIAATDGSDALAADNQRLNVVQVRSHLLVALADAAGAAAAGPYQPIDMLRFMLAPVAESPGSAVAEVNPVALLEVDVAQLDAAAIAGVDAVLVLRPDLLTERGTGALAGFADRGGVVWLIAPAIDASAAWGTALCNRLGLDWQIGVEPRTFEPATPGAEPAFWTLALEQAPEALNRLSADWEGLLRPISVHRMLDVAVPGGSNSVWLATDEGLPVLVTQRRGAGMVLLLTTALDTDWTNLPVKKLFTPLFHDALRSVLGAGEVDHAICGRPVPLHRRWDAVPRLVRSDGGASVAVTHAADAMHPTAAFVRPGLYAAPDGVAGLKLAVNVDADAGDLGTVDRDRLRVLLDADWLDQTDPATALTGARQSTPLGWPLLWVVLVLVLLETALARWFSHARQPVAARRGRPLQKVAR